MSFVIDPRGARDEVKTPIVAWQDETHVGTETWEGKLTKKATTPQVELRRMLDNGGVAMIRLNIGNAATNSHGKTVPVGVIMSSNKSVNLSWHEFYALERAIDEGITRLTAEHESIIAAMARKLAAKKEPAAAPVPAPQPEVAEGVPA